MKCVDWNATFVKMDKIMRQQPDYKVNPGESIKPRRNRKRDISLEERGMNIRKDSKKREFQFLLVNRRSLTLFSLIT